MSAAVAGGGGDQQDSGLGPLWLLIGLAVGIVSLWVAFHTYIVKGYFDLKLLEISLINFFTDQLGDVRTLILSVNPASVSYDKLANVAGAIGEYIKIPSALLLFLFAALLYFKSSVSHFQRSYSMKSLLNFVVKLWPQNKPGLMLDLISEDILVGPWAMSMHPMQFAKRYRLLKEKLEASVEGQLSRESKVTVSLVKSRANRLFAMQLGQPWRGVDKLKPHARALYAAFAAKAARDSQSSRLFLEALARSWENGKINFRGAEALLLKYKNDPYVAEVANKHGYELTVLASLLQLARTDGVLSSADFLWLKPIDRRLWFMLNNVGRQTANVEAAGPFAHWLAEKELGRKIMTPMIEEATNALEEAVQAMKYTRDEEKA